MYIVFAGIAAGIFLIDISLKHAIEERLCKNEERPLYGGKILIRRVHNKGVCLNLFQTHPDKVMLSSVCLGIVTLICDVFLLFRKGRVTKKIAMMLFTGGAFSNIYDRVTRGYVVDYIGFRTRWPMFTKITYNIGDFCIFVGSIVLCVSELLRRKD